MKWWGGRGWNAGDWDSGLFRTDDRIDRLNVKDKRFEEFLHEQKDERLVKWTGG